MVPHHVAIIMDGNGRWANRRSRPRIFGHVRGSSQVRPIVRECGRVGVKFLTLYAFSQENWGRPTHEVQLLMRILEKYLVRERTTLMENNVRLKAIGNLHALPPRALQTLQDTIELTKNNTGLTLTFALSYGSRQEIVGVVRAIAAKVKNGSLNPEDITEKLLTDSMMTAEMPDPDLIIRTSGERRVSNFLLWQSAYSEFYFIDKYWPEFTIKDLHCAFEDFQQRKRRFGKTDAQCALEEKNL